MPDWRSPGCLVWTPTDLSIAYPYGGTALGALAQELEFSPGYRVREEASGEDRGVDRVGVLLLGARPELTAVLAEWSAAALARAFPGCYAAGVLSALAQATYPGARAAGDWLDETDGGALLYVPTDDAGAPDTTQPWLLGRLAVPAYAQGRWVTLGARTARVLEVRFLLLRDPAATAATACWHWAGMEDLVL